MKLVIRKRYISSIILTLIIYTSTMLTRSSDLKFVVINLIVATIFALSLIIRDFESFRYLMNSKVIWWITAVWVMFILYGTLGPYKEAYSILYHLLNYIYVILFGVICCFHKDELLELLSQSFVITLAMIIIHTMIISGGNILPSLGEGIRIGNGGTGNVNTAAITYAFLLIPIVYQVFSNKNKYYIMPMIFGIVFMIITGSKKAVLFLLVVALVYLFSTGRNPSKILLNVLKVVVLIGAIFVVFYYIPVMNELVWSRLQSMVHSLQMYDRFDSSSTSLRITFIITALTKFWDKPFFGHGWGAFAQMYGYVSLYRMGLYTHCNYTEILFSFGIVGFLIYYIFPFSVYRRSKRIKSDYKILSLLFITTILCLDITSVTCYDVITGYLCVSIAYWLNDRTVANNS